MNTVVALVTIRTSIVTHKIDQLKYQYESALERSNVGLWVWIDTDHGQSWWSDSFLAFLGYSRGDIDPGFQTMMDLIHPDHLERFILTKIREGVGLYMTKRQIETLGGTISVESNINVGTTFKVIF